MALRLWEFPHSHFCEKARWALDHKGVDYQRISLFPGWHARQVRKLAPDSTVPVLLDGDQVIQGSSAIVSHLDRKLPARPLTDARREAEQLAMEAELDRELGESIRVILYHVMLSDPDSVRYYFMHRSPGYQRALFRVVYPVLASKIRGKYRIDDAGYEKALAGFHRKLDALDRVVERQSFLFGDAFSRVDMTAAALLAFVFMPPEHPVKWLPVKEPRIHALLAQLEQRPITAWGRRMYREHRATRR